MIDCKKRNLLQKYFCREDRACQRLSGSCSQRWWRRPPGCPTSTTDLTFSGAISLLSRKMNNHCNSLFIFRRITHSFKEGEEFRKDEDIHKWEQYLKMTFEYGLIYESIYMNNEYQVFGLSTDQLGHAKAPGFYWGALQSKVWTTEISCIISWTFHFLQGDPFPWEGEVIDLSYKKKRGWRVSEILVEKASNVLFIA